MNKQGELRLEAMRSMVGDVRKKVVLDLGACDFTIVDQEDCKKLITLDSREGAEIKCDLGVDKIPLKSNSVDVVISGEIVEHISNTLFFLSECKRVLKKNGFMVITTPNSCCLKDRIRMVFGKLPLQSARYLPGATDKYMFHVRNFNLEEITIALMDAGFKPSRVGTNGITFRSVLIWPILHTPVTLGENLVIKCLKKK